MIARVLIRQNADRRGAVALMLALMLPVLIGLGTLVVDQAYFSWRNILLRQTTEAAALAAGNALSSYHTTGSASGVIAAAQSFAVANDPSQRYGTPIPATNIVLGNWDSSSGSFSSLTSGSGSAPNAVQVTGVYSAANGNPVELFLGSFLGMPQKDVSTTVIATNMSSQPFHTIMINDLGTTFAQQILQQQGVDVAVLDCLANATTGSSQFGVTSFTGHGFVHQKLMPASANINAIKNQIAKLAPCGTGGAPSCSGSNVAASLYSAIQQLTGLKAGSGIKNVVIVTDNLPTAVPGLVYGLTDGILPALSGIFPSATANIPVCTTACTNADLMTMAQNQSAAALAAGISVSVIYYAGDTPPAFQSAYAAALATLRQGTGVAYVANTPADITSGFQAVCSTIPSSLVSVN